jgi:hypothetical protein
LIYPVEGVEKVKVKVGVGDSGKGNGKVKVEDNVLRVNLLPYLAEAYIVGLAHFFQASI